MYVCVCFFPSSAVYDAFLGCLSLALFSLAVAVLGLLPSPIGVGGCVHRLVVRALILMFLCTGPET